MSMLTTSADGSAVLANALGMVLDLTASGLGVRSKRYALIIDDLQVKYVGVDAKGVDKSGADAVLARL